MRNKLITIISLPVLCIASVWAQEKTTGSDMLQFDETTISASTVSGKELMNVRILIPPMHSTGNSTDCLSAKTESMGMEKDIQA